MNTLVGVNLSGKAQVLEALRRHLSRRLGSGIGIACRDVNGDPRELWPIERDAVMKAIPRRQREFAAGRMAAREAMNLIGRSAEAIPFNADRSPAWPLGVTGSISHSKHICVAVVANKEKVESIGIDIEEQLPIEPDLWMAICNPSELLSINLLPREAQGVRVRQIFSAKEAFYKWQYPITGRHLEFNDVTVRIDPVRCIFIACCSTYPPLPTKYSRVWGQCFNERLLFVSVITSNTQN